LANYATDASAAETVVEDPMVWRERQGVPGRREAI